MNNSGPALTPDQAGRAILSHITPLGAESQPLRAAAGRILRSDIHAERDNPPFDRVCMDGVAIDSRCVAQGGRRFRIAGTQGAGAPPLLLPAIDAALEVMTGAVLPGGADCVVPLEHYSVAGDALTLHAGIQPLPGANIQRRGSDSVPGIAMLRAGMRLAAAELAVVASAGLAQVDVGRMPRVAVVSNGDELVEPGQPIAAHQVRRSNAYALVAALQLQGFDQVVDTHVRDEPQALAARLETLLRERDVLVLSGGVSSGKFDFVPAALRAVGVREVFHHVEQRPGRPLWFGTGPAGQLVFGLPGNPVSTLVCLRRYVFPALHALMGGAPVPAREVALAAAVAGRRTTFFMPVMLQPSPAGDRALPHAPKGSGDFLALAGTDGFVELPPRDDGHAAGAVVPFYRW